MDNFAAFDTATPLTGRGSDIMKAGYGHILRYYSTYNHTKNLSHTEAHDLHMSGIKIGVVHENGFPTSSAYFTAPDIAKHDGLGMLQCAKSAQQPLGTCIFYAVDFDCTNIDPIVAYAKGVREALRGANGTLDYLPSVYGNGLVCKTLKDAGLVHATWLSGSRGWAGYAEWKDKADILQTTEGATVLVNIGADLDVVRNTGVFW